MLITLLFVSEIDALTLGLFESIAVWSAAAIAVVDSLPVTVVNTCERDPNSSIISTW